MSKTSRLQIAMLEIGQVGKETTVNEAFRALDVAVAAAAESVGTNTPPTSPADGQCFILGSSPTGVWAGQANTVAGYAPGGWRFVPAIAGMTVLDKSSGQMAAFDGTAWDVGTIKGAKLVLGGNQLVGPRLAAVAGPSGGATVDTEARAAIGLILDRMRSHGLIAT